MNQLGSPQDILEELTRQRDGNSKLYIPIPETPACTILLMGPTRAGKSTISETLEDTLHEPKKLSLYSCTRDPIPTQINGLRIIDMPGFNDVQKQNRTSLLDNNNIVQMLRDQLTKNNPVHLVAFVFSLANGIRQEDIDTMIFVQKNFPELTGRIMLVLTHAEELNHEGKSKLVEEFFEHPDVRKNNLQNFFQNEIMFLGCLRYESYSRMDYTGLQNEHQNVLKMRKKFIEKCFAKVPTINNQHYYNINSSSHSIQSTSSNSNFIKKCIVVMIIALFFYMYFIMKQNPSSTPVPSPTADNKSSIIENSALNKSNENQDNNRSTLDIILNATQNPEFKSLQSKLTDNELLTLILLEWIKSNQRIENIEKTNQKFGDILETIQNKLINDKKK